MADLSVADRWHRRAAATDLMVVPVAALRIVAVTLAAAVTVVHVADQGGITAFTVPDWLGWAYRLIEVGGLATAAALLLPRTARVGWFAGVLLGVAPFLGYLASRTVGVPGDAGDIGNWGDWVGTVAMVVEAALVGLSLTVLWALRRERIELDAILRRLDGTAETARLFQSWDVRPTSPN
jgi:hypothetical protein